MTEVQSTLLGAIIGGIIGICATYYGNRLARSATMETIKITEFNKAASLFRATFVNEIFLLRRDIATGDKKITHLFPSEVLVVHEKAKIMFEPFLNGEILHRFNIAWEEYKNCEYNYYATFSNERDQRSFNQYCLDHICNLLSYTNPVT
jgi:hypothetical protein